MTTRFKTYFTSPFVIILFLLILVIFSTCKKYPEGGFENRGHKILLKHNGAWTLTLYEVNGIDSTELINYNGDDKYKEVSFFKEDTKYNPHLYVRNYPSFTYEYQMTSNNENISVFSGSSNDPTTACFVNNSHYTGCYRLFLRPEGNNAEWNIVKLTKKELIITLSLKNNYKLKFKCR